MAGQHAGNARPPERQLIPGRPRSGSQSERRPTTASSAPTGCHCSTCWQPALVNPGLGSASLAAFQESNNIPLRQGKA
ncbi:unnamed protein product [Bubo scandiacus]